MKLIDVDKVVEKLTNESFQEFCDEHENRVVDLVTAIEIVRNADEEVCEWRMPNDNADEWTPSCDKNSTYNVFGVAWFKCCPYCRRKIKVVE